jgi:transposase-like protein
MCCRGLSLRGVAEVLRGMGFRASYEAVGGWFHRAGEFFPLASRRGRGYVAVDESFIRRLAEKAYLWAARGIGECIRFLERLKSS